jgi:alpha-L-rhamnosidase
MELLAKGDSKMAHLSGVWQILLILGTPHALADSKVWHGQWIWDRPPVSEQNVYDYFRKEFNLAGKPASAIVYVSADSRYQLYVNGHLANFGPVRSNQVNQSYDSYDVSQYLQQGANAIAAIVHFWGVGNERYILGQGGFLLECNILVPNNPAVLITSDSTWQALRSPAWNPNSPLENTPNGYTEIYDFNQEPAGWMLPGFNGTNWSSPVVIGTPPIAPWLNLTAREIPFMYQKPLKPARVVSVGEVQRKVPQNPLLVALEVQNETVQPVSTVTVSNPGYLVNGTGAVTTVTTPAAGQDAVIVLDFGSEISAYPSVALNGAAGTIVDVSFSEWLLNSQVVAVKSPVVCCGGMTLQSPIYTADRVILRTGAQTWQRFFYDGFRYMQLTIRNATQPVQISAAGATFTSYPFTLSGSFNSSDSLLNAIWNESAYTVLVTTEDAFVDCPGREKGQWMDMSGPMSSYYAYGNQAIAARYLRTTIQSQSAQGRMFLPYPSAFPFELPDQTMWWGMHLWQYYLHFGDITVLQDLYPALVQLNAWYQQNLSSRGLLNASWPDSPSGALWTWIDWGHRTNLNVARYLGGKQGEMAALDALYYKFLMDAASIANALGKTPDAQQFQAQAQALKTAFNTYYWDPVAGYYWDDVPHTIKGDQASILAVLYGIAPAANWVPIINSVMDSQYHVGQSSPSFYFFILQALSQAGMTNSGANAVRSLWGQMMAQGATTWWESWNLSLDHMGNPIPPGTIPHVSLAHNYGTSPLYFLSTRVLGVQPTGPGFSTFSVSPGTSAVQSVTGTVPTPRGVISVSWSSITTPANVFNLAVTAPPNSVASLFIPRLPSDTISLGSQIVWQAGHAVGNVPGVTISGSTSKLVTVQVQPGTYSLVSQ